MGLSVIYSNLSSYNRESDEGSPLDSFFKALIARRNEFRRNCTSLYLIVKLIILFGNGFNKACNTAELTGTACLFFVSIVKVCPLGNSFSVSNLRHTCFNITLIFSLHSLDINFQVELAHTLNNGLVRFLVYIASESRVFFCKAVKSLGHLIGSLFIFRCKRKRDNGIRNIHGAHCIV